jgi:hypothetical protein
VPLREPFPGLAFPGVPPFRPGLGKYFNSNSDGGFDMLKFYTKKYMGNIFLKKTAKCVPRKRMLFYVEVYSHGKKQRQKD